MDFTWDEEKSEATRSVRGFDFAFATLIFDEPCIIERDERRDYGEPRFVSIGVADGITLTVVFTDRIDARGTVIRRIISARRSNRRERRIHEHATSEGADQG
jgi:uncharacterized DUF497 family protein